MGISCQYNAVGIGWTSWTPLLCHRGEQRSYCSEVCKLFYSFHKRDCGLWIETFFWWLNFPNSYHSELYDFPRISQTKLGKIFVKFLSVMYYTGAACSVPPPQAQSVINFTKDGALVAVNSSYYPFRTVATHECPCGHQWPQYLVRVMNVTSCYGDFGWAPFNLTFCTPGEWREMIAL